MSWLKKIGHKVSKSLHRLKKGKFHFGHEYFSVHPKPIRRQLNKLRYGKFKNLIKKRLVGNNSAQAISIAGDSPSNGYVYNGRRLSEMM